MIINNTNADNIKIYREILSICSHALGLKGYKFSGAGRNSIIVRRECTSESTEYYEIKVKEVTECS